MGEQFVTRHRNRLLQGLSLEALDRLTPSLEAVVLPRRMKLAERDRHSAWVYFPSSGIASVVAQNRGCAQEVGIFSSEGAGCSTLVLGAPTSPHLIVMQVPGIGHRIRTSVIAAAFQEDREVRDAFLDGMLATVEQVSQTALANTHLNISQRLARWLLMVHDRVDGDEISMTHDYLSIMLGVARPGVTMALHSLERAGMIATARGQLTVIDRQALMAMTGGMYTHLGDRRLPYQGGTGIPDRKATMVGTSAESTGAL